MSSPNTAAVFPGQGVQEHIPKMTQELLESDPLSEKIFQEAGRFLGFNVLKLCLDGDNEKLEKSQFLQPAVAVASATAFNSLDRIGFLPDVVAGHSLGEYPALYAAKAITLESMCRLVQARAKFMEESNSDDPGRMTAVLSLSLDHLRTIAKDTGVDIAVHNVLQEAKEQIVLSGSRSAMAKAMEMVEALKRSDAILAARRRVNAVHLGIPYAAHSRGMRKARSRMAAFIRHVPIYNPQIRVVANGTGRYIHTAEQLRRDLPIQLTRTVLWHETVRFMESEGVTAIYEVGPGSVLSGINRQIVSDGVSLTPFDPSLGVYNFSHQEVVL